jgi:hypothetical protein
MSLYELCGWLQSTQTGTAIRESNWVFPIIETIHVLALALSVGLLVWFDLRLTGVVMRHEPVSTVHKQIMPWSLAGFVLMFLTGALLFWANALKAYENVYFQLKVLFLFVAGINAVIFEVTAKRNILEWDKTPVPPARVRLAGLLSLISWIAVITFGRATAYTF